MADRVLRLADGRIMCPLPACTATAAAAMQPPGLIQN
jgi:hypothetical protein